LFENNRPSILQKCLKTAPFDPWLHNELSLVYSDIGDKKKNADPGIPEIEEARARRRKE